MGGIVRLGVVAILGLAMCQAALAQPLTYYVAPQGNDAWSGTLAEPNAGASDGPWASLTGARDALRTLRGENKITGPVTVALRGGTYAVTEPIVFSPEDSGTLEAPITYIAYEDETPVISGGRTLTGFVEQDGRWILDIPEVQSGALWFSGLFVNGDRRQPARMPNPTHPWGDHPSDDEFFYTQGPVMEKDAEGKEQKSSIRVKYDPKDLAGIESLDDAVFVIFNSWTTSLLRLKDADVTAQMLEFTGPSMWYFGYWQEKQRYYIEHVKEGLDAPGEWYLDRKAGRLTYIPMPGEALANAEIVAPVAKQLIVLAGKPAEGKFVEFLTFDGLTLSHTDYTIEPEGYSDPQAAFSVNAAFEATGARRCVVQNCEISHVGNYGLWLRAGSQKNRVMTCEIFDLGAGGVRIGEGVSPATPEEAAQQNSVANCFIHEGGRIFRSAIGVWLGRTSFNNVTRNEICDFRYTGVSVGWSWGYEASSAHDNRIEYNHIHHIGLNQLNDMGGIYCLGISPGTELRNNVIHDVFSHPSLYGGWGLYTDEGSSGILITHNVVYNTRTGTFHQHYGRENRVENNILAFSHTPQIIRSRQEEHISFYFRNNIVYFNNGQLLGSTWKNGNWVMDNNVYWDASGMDLDFAGRSLEDWQKEGFDQHSVVADPMFKDPAGGDFSLSPDSPAYALGFQSIDISQVGLYGDEEWVNKPKQIQREPFTPPQLPKPTTISLDFDAVDVGAAAPDAHTLGETADATIRVSDETAKSGARSLKFVDAPGLDQAFNPHLVFAPHLRSGVATGSFSVKVEPGAVLYHEWRDGHQPYRVGPSLWIQGGALSSQGQTLMAVPDGAWIDISITCPLGSKATGQYHVDVQIGGQPSGSFDLACGSADFNRLDWFGFVSNSTEATTFFVDDVQLTAD